MLPSQTPLSSFVWYSMGFWGIWPVVVPLRLCQLDYLFRLFRCYSYSWNRKWYIFCCTVIWVSKYTNAPQDIFFIFWSEMRKPARLTFLFNRLQELAFNMWLMHCYFYSLLDSFNWIKIESSTDWKIQVVIQPYSKFTFGKPLLPVTVMSHDSSCVVSYFHCCMFQTSVHSRL